MGTARAEYMAIVAALAVNQSACNEPYSDDSLAVKAMIIWKHADGYFTNNHIEGIKNEHE